MADRWISCYFAKYAMRKILIQIYNLILIVEILIHTAKMYN